MAEASGEDVAAAAEEAGGRERSCGRRCCRRGKEGLVRFRSSYYNRALKLGQFNACIFSGVAQRHRGGGRDFGGEPGGAKPRERR